MIFAMFGQVDVDHGVGEGVEGLDLGELERLEAEHAGQRQAERAEHADLEELAAAPGRADVGVVTLAIAVHFHGGGEGLGLRQVYQPAVALK